MVFSSLTRSEATQSIKLGSRGWHPGGGWQLALVNAYNSGSRLAATVPNTLLFFNGGLRPDLVSGNIRRHVSMSDFDPARHLYLNRSAFALPAEGKFGSAPRYLEVRGPARLDESFAVAKNTRIREGVTQPSVRTACVSGRLICDDDVLEHKSTAR